MNATDPILPAAPQTRRTFIKTTAAAATIATVSRLPDALASG
jgi:predicted secreted protein